MTLFDFVYQTNEEFGIFNIFKKQTQPILKWNSNEYKYILRHKTLLFLVSCDKIEVFEVKPKNISIEYIDTITINLKYTHDNKNYFSKVFIAFEKYEIPYLAYIDGDSKKLIKLISNLDTYESNPLEYKNQYEIRWLPIEIRTIIFNIDTILHQDGYFYIFEKNKLHKTRVHVLRPDLGYFNYFEINDIIINPIFYGHRILYISKSSSFKLMAYETCLKTYHTLLEYKHTDIINCFTLTPTHIYILTTSNQFESYKYNMHEYKCTLYNKGLYIHSENAIDYISFFDYKYDFQINTNLITKCHVQSFFIDEMNLNDAWLAKLLVNLGINIYSNENYIKYINESKDKYIHTINVFRDINKTIYIGNDIYDIVNYPRNMFKDAYGYQWILNDMNSLYHSSNKDISNKIYNYSIESGLNIIPTYNFSGVFHYIYPLYGKGWHHNIESVPNKTVDVIYFVSTDKDEFGGSFFFYRHPITHAIHAVPDIHGTYKFFLLNSNMSNPLWHAIGSITAHRLSMGFSKTSDMQTPTVDKDNSKKIKPNKPLTFLRN